MHIPLAGRSARFDLGFAHYLVRSICCGIIFVLLCCFEARAWNAEVVGGQCRQTSALCTATIGNAGQGRGACCDPSDPNVVQCANQNPCIGGRSYKWQNIPVSWWLNANNMAGQAGYAGLSLTQIEDALKRGWDAWTKPGCTAFQHSYRGQSTLLPSISGQVDKQLVLYLPNASQWAQLGGGSQVLAFSVPVPDNNGNLLDADIVFGPNPSGGWKISPNMRSHEIDLVGVAAHEIGHSIGFAHSQFSSALMFYTAKPGPFSALSQDDIDAVCFIYPGNCTKDADCGNCLYCPAGKCVRRQIPTVRNLCMPCTQPADCGNINDICIRVPAQGNRCAQDCSKDDCCPDGYRCIEIGLGQKMCMHETGKCPDIRCTSDAICGPGESCQSGVCKPKPVNPETYLCKSCSKDADCGNNGTCLSFPDKNSRCTQPCVADNFCPTGFVCQTISGKRLCTPDQFICPCRTNTDCLQGESCRNGLLCRPASCKYLCPCSDNAPCDAGYTCFQTSDGGYCFMPCGGTNQGNFPEGSPGSACTASGTCTLGAQCYSLQSGGTICIKPCKSNNDCASTGGKCYQLGNQNFCICQADSECLTNQACNTSVLGSSGGGACAPKTTAATCEPGFECKDAGGVQICQPKPSRQAGESCSETQLCLTDLFCVNTSSSASENVCVEDCTQTNQCKYGGSCILQSGNNKFCGCTNQSQCNTGYYCKMIAGASGVCVKYDPSSCGNGSCEPAKGENCFTCPKDCPCPSGQTCNNGVCQAPAQNCGNGSCEPTKGENCSTCPKDCPCPSGQTCNNGVCQAPAQNCGNGSCEPAKGENCSTCPQDCGCTAGQVCNNGVCQAPAQSCGNNSCEPAQGENCSTCPQDCGCTAGQVCNNGVCQAPPQTCGNGSCESAQGENCSTCPQDCGCGSGMTCINGRCQAAPQTCGNGVCDRELGEDCGSCPGDCPCEQGRVCENNRCVVALSCGNGVCEAQYNENCANCPRDCACPSHQSCQNNRCVDISKPKCATDEQIQKCDDDGKNCQLICPFELCEPNERLEQCDEDGKNCKLICPADKKGCACSVTAHNPTSKYALLLLLCLLFILCLGRRKTT